MNLKNTLRDGASAIAFLAGRDPKTTAKVVLNAESGDDDDKPDDKKDAKKSKAKADEEKNPAECEDGDDTGDKKDGDDNEEQEASAGDGTEGEGDDDKDKKKDAKKAKADDGDDKSDEKEMRSSSSVAQARTRERARCRAIVTSAEAKRNPALANHLAFKTTMTRGEALEALKDAPAGAAASGREARNPNLAPQSEANAGTSKQAIVSSWDHAFKQAAPPARKR